MLMSQICQIAQTRGSLDGSDDEPMPLPNPMVSFNLSNGLRSVNRSLRGETIGPPYVFGQCSCEYLNQCSSDSRSVGAQD